MRSRTLHSNFAREGTTSVMEQTPDQTVKSQDQDKDLAEVGKLFLPVWLN